MIVVMAYGATEAEIEAVTERLTQEGYRLHVSRGVERTIVGVLGENTEGVYGVASMPGVEQVMPVTRPYKLVSREFHPDDSVIQVGDVAVGGKRIAVMAGPCAVESRDQVMEAAKTVHDLGLPILRGGAYKPRTSPYSFQGLGVDGLKILAEARDRYGLKIVTEAMDHESLEAVAEWADIIQIGARNMQNFSLLKLAGQAKKPVLLKRGLSATIDEWLMAAEYIVTHGNPNVILCERGIRTYEPKTRNTLDLSAVPVVKQLSHLPIVIDPSHSTGKWDWVAPMARAAVAAGADGLIIEAHPDPTQALSDGPQSLNMPHLIELVESLRSLAEVVGRTL